MNTIRLKRLARELQIRRRRLDVFPCSDPWPGKEAAWRMERASYDSLLVMAAEMLEVELPALPPGPPLPGDVRATIEDRLALAGLNVFVYREDVVTDLGFEGDLFS